MNSSAKPILIGWIYRRIGFLKRGMKKQIKPLAAILRFLDFSIPRYRHFERSEKSSLHFVLSCSFRKRFPLFRCLTYDIIPSCKKDPSTSLGMTIRERRFPNISFIRDVGYPFPHTVISSAVEKSSLHSALSCSFHKRIPLPCCRTYSAIPVCQKDPSTSVGMTLQKWRFPNISVVRYVK